jgi:hypothetical protein
MIYALLDTLTGKKLSKASLYKIENTETGKMYIGATCSGARYRWLDHLLRVWKESRSGKDSNESLQADIALYGKENFTFSVLAVLPCNTAAEQVIVYEQEMALFD